MKAHRVFIRVREVGGPQKVGRRYRERWNWKNLRSAPAFKVYHPQVTEWVQVFLSRAVLGTQ